MATLRLAFTAYVLLTPVIQIAVVTGSTYIAFKDGPVCLDIHMEQNITSSFECLNAAASLGYTGYFHIGNYGHAPPGCHVGHPTDGWAHIYFNEHPTGRTGRSIYRTICRNQGTPLGFADPCPGFGSLDQDNFNLAVIEAMNANQKTTLASEVVLLTGGGPGTETSVEVFGQPGCSPSITIPTQDGIRMKDSKGVIHIHFFDGHSGNRTSHTSHYIDGKVLVCGGKENSGSRRSCIELVDGNFERWTADFSAHSILTRGRHLHSGVIFGKRLIMMGGANSPRKIETGIVRERGWTTRGKDDMEHSVVGSCVVPLDKIQALVIGGMGNVEDESVSLYDNIKDHWSRKRGLSHNRWGHSCMVLENGKVLIAGGEYCDKGGALNTALVYNIACDTWEELPGRLNTARLFGQMVKMNGRILYFGGQDEHNSPLNTVEEFNEGTGTWSLLSETMKTARTKFSAVAIPASRVECSN